MYQQPNVASASALPSQGKPSGVGVPRSSIPRRHATAVGRAKASTHLSSASLQRQSIAAAASSIDGAATTSTASATAYSRTSWRTAILAETDQSSASPDGPADPTPPSHELERRNSPSGSASRVGAHHPSSEAPSVDSDSNGDGDGSGVGGTLSAAELRVKLSLAAGSGRLDLTDCRLRALPVGVLELTELEELQLSGNCLAQLPEGISRLTALRRLGLAGNSLTQLPAGLGALTALEGLWLHGNLLEELPPQLGRLTALRALSLAGNCIESVPPGCLAGMTSLTDLTLAGNRLARLPPRELAPLTRLRKLALNGNRLQSGPPGELGLGTHMASLAELMLQGNCLTEVDPAIFECPALSELSLADNALTSLLPPGRLLSGASSLSRLHLFGNALTTLPAAQLASLPALSACWLEGNPLGGAAVGELLAVSGAGGMPRLKALGLDQRQIAAWRRQLEQQQQQQQQQPLPSNVRVGCVQGSGPGYFKLQYGPQRPGTGASGHMGGSRGAGASQAASAYDDEDSGGGSEGVATSGNELLVVAFGSAPGTPNWGGLLGKVYQAATAEAERHFDVLYVADPARDWYGGGDDAVLSYYRSRLSAYTRQYRRVLLLGDSMGATAALLFADLATAALAFCPQVDLKEASIRPGRPAAWLDALRARLEAAVRASAGELVVLVGTWQHDLAQANLLPQANLGGLPQGEAGGQGPQQLGRGRGRGRGQGQERGEPRGTARSWRHEGPEDGGVAERSNSGSGSGSGVAGRASMTAQRQAGHDGGGWSSSSSSPSSSLRRAAGPAAHRSPWAWQQEGEEEGRGVQGSLSASTAQQSGVRESHAGGVSVRVFSVDSHRLAAALDARGQLVPLVRDMILHQLGLRSGNVRVSNLL